MNNQLRQKCIEAGARAIAAHYAIEGNARGYGIIARPWEDMGEDERSWWLSEAEVALDTSLTVLANNADERLWCEAHQQPSVEVGKGATYCTLTLLPPFEPDEDGECRMVQAVVVPLGT